MSNQKANIVLCLIEITYATKNKVGTFYKGHSKLSHKGLVLLNDNNEFWSKIEKVRTIQQAFARTNNKFDINTNKIISVKTTPISYHGKTTYSPL